MKTLPLLLLAALLVPLAPSRALAGGLYFNERGSRQLGRGGAFVAGTDDGQSLWYNPAGLSFAGNQLHVDGTLTLFRGSFTRTSRDDVNIQDGQHPTVTPKTAPLPIPTLALTHDLGLRDFTFGLALMAPSALITTWPENLGTDEAGNVRPAPQRYSLVSMEGSAIANLALGAAWHGVKGLSIGVGVHLIAARFRAAVVMSACDYGFLCLHPEQQEWDGPVVIDLERAVTATANAGVIYGRDRWKVGLSVMAPYRLGGDAKLEVQLPSAAAFEGAQVTGDKAEINLDFPLIARLGVEVKPLDALRLEVAVGLERWSTQKEMRIKPKGVRIRNVVGIDPYEVKESAVPRNMKDVLSLRVGGEYALDWKRPLVLRLGGSLETSAFPDSTLTPLTLDSDRLMVALGGSVEVIDGLWLDLVYGHVFMRDRTVTNSVVYPQNAIEPPSDEESSEQLASPEPIGNGRYEMEADFLGGGLRWVL